MPEANYPDHVAIRELVDRYTDRLNQRNFAALADLFTADATWQVDAPFNLFFQGAEIARSIEALLVRFPFLIQLVHGTAVELEADFATARTTIRELGQAADGASGLDSYGIYHDRLVRTPSGWRFAARRFQPLYMQTGPLPGTILA